MKANIPIQETRKLKNDHHHGSELFLKFPELLLVENYLMESVERAHGTIKDTYRSLLTSGGKRLRPLLTLQSAQCFGPLNTATIQASVAAELIHMASLIHDDVIDHSDLRRGSPTANALRGNQIAVLIGDYLFAEAFHILSSEHLATSMGYLVEAIKGMCHGEIQQAEDQFHLDEDEEEESYFKRIAEKTGILFSSCCRSGAATAGASPEEIEVLGKYGLYLGYAYQIVDDIIDFSSDRETAGKPVASDLMNGYITLPMIYLLENPQYNSCVRAILENKKLTKSSVQKIMRALVTSEALDDAFATALECTQNAITSLEELSASPAKTFLRDLALKTLYRKA